uniref:Uncharacterized protein n=1 Tax=Globisporangium ultimum (strain ATCC 200006 / CBS 805.95 / DAOM BR144) TaxID=431595 RepID=K3WZD9_GLOUD
MCQVSFTLIYPACIYGFMPIDPDAEPLYIILLPTLKLALKHFLGDLDDLKPEIVVFNVEVFNALYAMLSLCDINHMHTVICKCMATIPKDHEWRGKPFTKVALLIIEKDLRI